MSDFRPAHGIFHQVGPLPSRRIRTMVAGDAGRLLGGLVTLKKCDPSSHRRSAH
jgi:hypothetical protein